METGALIAPRRRAAIDRSEVVYCSTWGKGSIHFMIIVEYTT
jgi:hypothetical protein